MINIQPYELFFFDFDGTLKYSDDIKGKIFYKIFGKEINNKIQKKIFLHHKSNHGIPRSEKIPYYMKLAGIKTTKKNQDYYLKKYKNLIFKEVCNSKWVPGSKLFLKKIQDKKIILLTASPHVEIIKILKQIKIKNFFDKIYGYPNKKGDVIKRFLLKNKINSNKCIYFGNSQSDFNAAFKNKINYINIGPIKIKGQKIKKIRNFKKIVFVD